MAVPITVFFVCLAAGAYASSPWLPASRGEADGSPLVSGADPGTSSAQPPGL
jgi:hypothetical protein